MQLFYVQKTYASLEKVDLENMLIRGRIFSKNMEAEI